MPFIDKGAVNCAGDVVFDTSTEPGMIISTCNKCSLIYKTAKL